MKKRNSALSVVLAAILLLSVTACGSASSSDSSATTTAPVEVTTTVSSMKEEDKKIVEEIEVENTEKLENGVVKWLSFWDINPVGGKAVPVELELFQTRYGGSIEYIQTTWDDRYDKLAALVLAGTSPDMFPAGDLDAFPRGVISDLIAPLDDYVDFGNELWTPMAPVNDQFMCRGKHYVAATSTDAGVVMIYNKKTIEENALSDPRQLLADNNWNWNTFKDMMSAFCKRSESKFAIDGWWFEGALALTTGKPYIGMENGKIVSNLFTPEITKVQEFMQEINKLDYPYPKAEHAWEICAANIGAGLTLFYPCGVWSLYVADFSDFGEAEDVAFVPMPKCPDADKYYLPTAVSAYALCAGSQNPEGVAAFVTCARIAFEDKSAKEIAKKQLFDDYGWSEGMYEDLQAVQALTAINPIIEFYSAVSPTLAELVNNPMKESYNSGASWTQTREMIANAVDSEIDKSNGKLG